MKLKLTRPLITFDLETTGTEVARDRIVQISVSKLYPNGDSVRKTKLINPTIPIPKEASDVHGIKDEDVKDAPTFREIASGLLATMSGCDLHGFNMLRFDLPLIVEEFLRCDIEFPEPDTRFVDSQVIFHRKEERTLSAALRFYCNEDHENAHDAEADVIATEKVLMAEIDRYEDVGDSVETLASFCIGDQPIVDFARKLTKKDGEIVFTFGKNEGRRVVDCVDYCYWMLRNDFPLHTKRVIRSLLNA